MSSVSVSVEWLITIMNIVGVGAAFCMGCCPNICNGTAIAAPAVWVSPPMVGRGGPDRRS